MSDALTDIERDRHRSELLEEIDTAERDFLKLSTGQKARRLIELWKMYIYTPGGYWTSSNKTWAYERIGYLTRYLETGEVPNLPGVRLEEDPPGVIDTIIRVGAGFIVDRIEDRILDEIYKVCKGPLNYKNFHVRLVLEKAEEVTCKTCPNLSDICGYHYGCESKRMEELHVRKALADVGRHTIHRERRIPDENGI